MSSVDNPALVGNIEFGSGEGSPVSALAMARGRSPACALALPRLSPRIPRSVVPVRLASGNARISRFLLDAGVFEDCDVPDAVDDSMRACEQAFSRWFQRRIGPLQCLRPGFGMHLTDQHDAYITAVGRDGRMPAYAGVELYWAEIRECEWPVGERLQALEQSMPGLGEAVLQALRQQGRSYPLFTPDIACDVASYVYWCGEDDEEAALDLRCGEDEEDREAVRAEMITRAMLEAAYPAWARRWPRGEGAPGRHARALRRARKSADPAIRQIASDALALSQLHFDDAFRPDCDGEYIGFGAVLSWAPGDVTVRIYDDLLQQAHESEFCDRMGQVSIALDVPGALGAWQLAMDSRFEAIRLIDRLIHQLSA